MRRGDGPTSARPTGNGRGPRTERDMRRRELSQNFLRDPGAERYLSLVDFDPDFACVEVGAGEGALTRRLIGRSRRLVAYEIDTDVARTLRDRIGRRPGVEIVVGDFLASRPLDEPFQLVGNVPFSLTAAIVEWCLHAHGLTSATIITQLEYAKKRTGGYGRWSQLTILSWPEFWWELRGQIPRTQFQPVPATDAGVLHIEYRGTSLIPRERLAAYHRMVEVGFGGVGGTLFASLSRLYSGNRLVDAFRRASIERSTVVAFVAPEQWITLFQALDRKPSRRS